MESTIYSLDKGRWDKEAPMKVAETRLFNRHARPNVEMCRDETSHRYIIDYITFWCILYIVEMRSTMFLHSFIIFRLLEEVSELEHSMRQLELKNENSEASLRDMQVCNSKSVL